MLHYAARRAFGIVVALFALVTAAFFVIRLAPGGPFDHERALPPAVKANVEAAYGLDRPLLVQYVDYVRRAVRADFGPSLRYTGHSVDELIAQSLPVSLTVGAAALVTALSAGIALGVLAGLRRAGVADHCLAALTVVGLALPGFVVGPLLALVFGVHLRWLPVAGWGDGSPEYLVLPVLTLALPLAAYVARLTRDGLIEALSSDHVRAARARGLGELRVIRRHALRPALFPVVSYLGPATAALLAGSLVVETVFALPGTGRYLVQGAIDRDYGLVMGMVIVYGSLTLLANLAADLLYGWLDPRVRHG